MRLGTTGTNGKWEASGQQLVTHGDEMLASCIYLMGPVSQYEPIYMWAAALLSIKAVPQQLP